jgi:hypothetical protein
MVARARKSSRIDDRQRRLSHYSEPAFQAGFGVAKKKSPAEGRGSNSEQRYR